MRRLLVSLIGSALLLLILQPATAGAAGVPDHATRGPAGTPACGEEWGVDYTPSPAGGSQLEGVSAISSKDVWTVGEVFSGTLLSEHWDGTAWSVVSTPNPGPPGGENLAAVSGVASNDVWAVGYYNDSNGVTSPLVLHWDGTSWTQSPVPVQPGHVYQLLGVTAISSTDVWAVGISNAGGPTAVSSSDRQLTLAFHWDGTSWARVQTPDPDNGNLFTSVTAISSNDVWAVGLHYAPPAYFGKPLTEHWDGNRWTVVASPVLAGNTILRGVASVAAADVWAVGEEVVSGQPQVITLAMHWDGTSWTVVPTPNPGDSENQLFGVSAAASGNVYAVGDSIYFNHAPQQAALIERWDGTSWTVVANPNPSTDVNFLYSVSARHSGAAWAVGNDFNTQTFQEDTLIERTPKC